MNYPRATPSGFPSHTPFAQQGLTPLPVMLSPLWGLGMRIVWDMHVRCGTWEPRRGDHNTGTGVNPCVHSADTVQNPEGVARIHGRPHVPPDGIIFLTSAK